jgi:glycosyltransferase involved in cell wall biosynthesis
VKVLAVTNMLPTIDCPWQGTFIESQIESLKPLVDTQTLHIHRVQSGRGAYLQVRARLRRAMAEGRPDVIHVMYGGALALLVATAAENLPLVVSFCGSDLFGDPQRSWKRRGIGRLTVWASKLAALRADAVITKSRQLAARVPSIVSRDKIHVIPNGVDLDRFRPLDTTLCRRQLAWAEEEFHVLFTGDPANETKRFADALSAVECLRARGVPARLQLMRGLSHDQVPVWLNAAHVLLLCSLHEGSPNIVKESLACECPVVSTDVGDVAERIEGIQGCYLSDRNTQSLADCLEAVLRNGSRLNCRHQITSIALRATAERVISIYHNVCQRGCTRAHLTSLDRTA